MRRYAALVLNALLWLGLVGCASTPDSPANSAPDFQQAAKANTQLGVGYFQQANYERAHNKLQKAVEQEPNRADAWLYLALASEQLGRHQQAKQAFEQARSNASNNLSMYSAAADYACRQAEFAQAESLLAAAKARKLLANDAELFTELGRCALQADAPNVAEVYLERALSLNSDAPRALLVLGRLRTEQQRYGAAKQLLTRFQTQHKDTAASLLLGLRIAEAAGDQREAKVLQEKIRNKYPEVWNNYQQRQAFISRESSRANAEASSE